MTSIRGADALQGVRLPARRLPEVPDFPEDSGDDSFAIDASTLSTLISRDVLDGPRNQPTRSTVS